MEEELLQFLLELRSRLLRYFIISLILFLFFLSLIVIYPEARLFNIIDNVVIIDPLDSFWLIILIPLVYTLIFSIPIFLLFMYKFITEALYEYERKIVRIYFIVLSIIPFLSLLYVKYIFFPKIISLSIVLSEIIGTKIMFSALTLVKLFFTIFLITLFSFTLPLILDMILRYKIEPLYNIILKKIYRNKEDKMKIYVGLYFIYAIITPGDLVLITLILWFTTTLLLEIIYYIHRNHINQ